jgi:uncharacterized protein (TIGR02145 family)
VANPCEKGYDCDCLETEIREIPTCNTNLPGWGKRLGTLSFATDEKWTISGNGITQIWSDAVTATNCQKTTFSGDDWRTQSFSADCRSNPGQKGDFFSWCAVVRFQEVLCPAPWRVPTNGDFRDLDIAMGGTGNNRFGSEFIPFINDNYLGLWGGAYNGNCNSSGLSYYQGSNATYWSSTEINAVNAHRLGLGILGGINPQSSIEKNFGLTLRCVQ